MTWRLVTHERMTATLHEIKTHWCLDDVIEAHAILDALELAAAEE